MTGGMSCGIGRGESWGMGQGGVSWGIGRGESRGVGQGGVSRA